LDVVDLIKSSTTIFVALTSSVQNFANPNWSTARTFVSYAEAEINIKLVDDLLNLIFANPSDSNISTLPSLWY